MVLKFVYGSLLCRRQSSLRDGQINQSPDITKHEDSRIQSRLFGKLVVSRFSLAFLCFYYSVESIELQTMAFATNNESTPWYQIACKVLCPQSYPSCGISDRKKLAKFLLNISTCSYRQLHLPLFLVGGSTEVSMVEAGSSSKVRRTTPSHLRIPEGPQIPVIMVIRFRGLGLYGKALGTIRGIGSGRGARSRERTLTRSLRSEAPTDLKILTKDLVHNMLGP